jgi:hypothetical protein
MNTTIKKRPVTQSTINEQEATSEKQIGKSSDATNAKLTMLDAADSTTQIKTIETVFEEK